MVIQKFGHLLLAFSFHFGMQIKMIKSRWTVQMNVTLIIPVLLSVFQFQSTSWQLTTLNAHMR